jgi:hypothetical protein
MPRELTHEEIAERFIQAKVVDFSAMGRLVAELGPTLAVSDRGWHGVNFGRFHVLACSMPAAELERVVGSLKTANLTTAALEAAETAAFGR